MNQQAQKRLEISLLGDFIIKHFRSFQLRLLEVSVGSQLSDFWQTRKKIDDVVVNNWMHVPIDQKVSKPKIICCPDL